MNTGFEIRVYATSVRIYPGREAVEPLSPLINLLTYEDEFQEMTKTLGYILDEEQDLLYFHKGVDISYIHRLLGNAKVVHMPADDARHMQFEYEEIVPPRNNEQVDCINFIMGINQHKDNENDRQIFLVKNPGFGKTFCSGVAACRYGVKTLIIMHRDSLRKQWLNSLYKMCGLSEDEVHEIQDSQEVFDIVHDNHEFDYDIYLMTHATFRAGLKRVGNFKEMSNLTKNLGIGLKIIDEAHLEFRDTLLMDFVFNVQRNLYLTATDGRSTKAENSIFKHVFANTTFYHPSTLLTSNQPSKWVEYNMVQLNTHAKQNIVRYRVEGGRGMNPATYGKWVIAYDKKQTHFKCCRDILKMIYEKDPSAKVLLFMPLIDLCTECSYFLTKNLNYDESFAYDLTIRTINSKNTKAENEENKHADVIVTTVASCGTGTDIPGITDIINCSPFVSQVTAKQVFGRIRYCGKDCHFYDVYDASVRMDGYWIKSRSKVFKQLSTKTNYITWEDDAEEDAS
jgi:hypothetical protein